MCHHFALISSLRECVWVCVCISCVFHQFRSIVKKRITANTSFASLVLCEPVKSCMHKMCFAKIFVNRYTDTRTPFAIRLLILSGDFFFVDVTNRLFSYAAPSLHWECFIFIHSIVAEWLTHSKRRKGGGKRNCGYANNDWSFFISVWAELSWVNVTRRPPH